jgi:hypothetical protein
MPKAEREAIEYEEEIFGFLHQSHVSAGNSVAPLGILRGHVEPSVVWARTLCQVLFVTILETVATVPQARGRTAQTGGLQRLGHCSRHQSQELLAPLPNDGNTVGHERRMAQITGLGFHT